MAHKKKDYLLSLLNKHIYNSVTSFLLYDVLYTHGICACCSSYCVSLLSFCESVHLYRVDSLRSDAAGH